MTNCRNSLSFRWSLLISTGDEGRGGFSDPTLTQHTHSIVSQKSCESPAPGREASLPTTLERHWPPASREPGLAPVPGLVVAFTADGTWADSPKSLGRRPRPSPAGPWASRGPARAAGHTPISSPSVLGQSGEAGEVAQVGGRGTPSQAVETLLPSLIQMQPSRSLSRCPGPELEQGALRRGRQEPCQAVPRGVLATLLGVAMGVPRPSPGCASGASLAPSQAAGGLPAGASLAPSPGRAPGVPPLPRPCHGIPAPSPLPGPCPGRPAPSQAVPAGGRPRPSQAVPAGVRPPRACPRASWPCGSIASSGVPRPQLTLAHTTCHLLT